ncbi:unnamed protein product, partial [Meganyctiphanes norvegica]
SASVPTMHRQRLNHSHANSRGHGGRHYAVVALATALLVAPSLLASNHGRASAAATSSSSWLPPRRNTGSSTTTSTKLRNGFVDNTGINMDSLGFGEVGMSWDDALGGLKGAYNKRAPRMRMSKFTSMDSNLQYFSKEQMEAALVSEYGVVPYDVVAASGAVGKGVNCSGLQSNMHPNLIPREAQLHPSWLYASSLIGDCPVHYVERALPPLYHPPRLLEAVCSCQGSQCSQEGHQCVPISRLMPVWVRRGAGQYVMDVEEVTVICACVMRTSITANSLYRVSMHT